MTAEANKSLVRRSIEELLVRGDLAVSDEVYAVEYVNHDPSNPAVADLTSTKAFIEEMRATYSNIDVSIDDQIAKGDRVATRWTFGAVDTGLSSEAALAGNCVSIEGIAISRIDGGRIVEEWVQWDALGL